MADSDRTARSPVIVRKSYRIQAKNGRVTCWLESFDGNAVKRLRRVAVGLNFSEHYWMTNRAACVSADTLPVLYLRKSPTDLPFWAMNAYEREVHADALVVLRDLAERFDVICTLSEARAKAIEAVSATQ